MIPEECQESSAVDMLKTYVLNRRTSQYAMFIQCPWNSIQLRACFHSGIRLIVDKILSEKHSQMGSVTP